MTQQRTPITEAASGRVGDAPATPEDLSSMSLDRQQDAANDFWLAKLPAPGPAPTEQPVKTLSDLLGPG